MRNLTKILSLLSLLMWSACAVAQPFQGNIPSDTVIGRDSPGVGQTEVLGESAFKAMFNLEIGTDVQEYSSDLDVLADPGSLSNEASPGSGDLFVAYIDGAYKTVDFDDLIASLSAFNLVDDTSPQLGGDLDQNGFVFELGNGNTDTSVTRLNAGVMGVEGVAVLLDSTGSVDSANIADGSIVEGDLSAIDSPADEECLTYEGGNFEWQACIPDADYGDVAVSSSATVWTVQSVGGRTFTTADAGFDAVFGWDDSDGVYKNLAAADVRAALDLEPDTDFYSKSSADSTFQPLNTHLTTLSDPDALDNEASPASGDKFIAYIDGAYRTVDFDDMPSGGGSISDGDKGDVNVSSSGTVWTVQSINSLTFTPADAGADAIFGWDDSQSAYENLTKSEAQTVLGLQTSTTDNQLVRYDSTAGNQQGSDILVTDAPALFAMNQGGSGNEVGMINATAAGQMTIGMKTTAGVIQGAYFSIWGNNFGDTHKGSAEFTFDSRNGATAGFTIYEYNGSGWTNRFQVPVGGGATIGNAAFTTGTIEMANGTSNTLSASGGTLSIEGNAMYRAGGTDVALADGGTGASLSDPNADRIMWWDDSDGAIELTSLSALTTEASPAAGDFLLMVDASGALLKVDWDDLPAGGGSGSQTPWESNIDADGFNLNFDDATGILDSSGNEQLIFQETASAENYLEITNAADAGAPSLAAVGDDTNINLLLAGKGSGNVTAANFRTGSTGALITTFMDEINFTLTPSMQVLGTSASTAAFGTARFSNTFANSQGRWIMARSRGTSVGTYTVVQDDDGLGMLVFEGADGTDFTPASAILGLVDGTPGNDDMPGRMEFATTADGSGSVTTRMVIKADGGVILGTDAASPGAGNLAVSGRIIDINPAASSSLSILYNDTAASQFYIGMYDPGSGLGAGAFQVAYGEDVSSTGGAFYVEGNSTGSSPTSSWMYRISEQTGVSTWITNVDIGRAYAGITAYGITNNSSNYEGILIRQVAASDYAEVAAVTGGTGDDDLDVKLTPAGLGGVRATRFSTDTSITASGSELAPDHDLATDPESSGWTIDDATYTTGSLTWTYPTNSGASGPMVPVDVEAGHYYLFEVDYQLTTSDTTPYLFFEFWNNGWNQSQVPVTGGVPATARWFTRVTSTNTAQFAVNSSLNASGDELVITRISAKEVTTLPGEAITAYDYNGDPVLQLGGFGDYVRIGRNACLNVDSGVESVCIGYGAFEQGTIGKYVVAIGSGAMGNSSGSNTYDNTAVGALALRDTTGRGNTAIGILAGVGNTSGINNVFAGYVGTSNAEGSYNIYIGHNTALSLISDGTSTNQENIAMGHNTMWNIVSGYGNVCIGGGNNSGADSAGNNCPTLQSGNKNLVLGWGADVPTSSTSTYLNIQKTIFGDMAAGPIHFAVPILVDGTSSGPGSLQIAEDTDNGTNKITLTAPASIGSNRTITFPDSDGHVIVSEHITFAMSDEDTPLTAGTAKITFRNPFNSVFTVTDVKCNVNTAQGSGDLITVDINEGGSPILSTPVTIDNGEKTSVTADAPPVISDSSIASDAEMTADITDIDGSSAATGLKCSLIGYH